MTHTELRRLRERAGLTQKELAKMADIGERTLIDWEKGVRPIGKLEGLGLRELLTRAAGGRAT